MALITPSASAGPVTLLSDSGELSGAAATFDVQNIAQGYVDLAFVLTARGDTAATNTNVTLTLNNDTGANYDNEQLTANAATPTSAEALAAAGFTQIAMPAANAPAGVFTAAEGTVFAYSSATPNKIMHCLNDRKTGVASGNILSKWLMGQWRSSAAVTRVTFTPAAGNFAAGSRLRIYGKL